MVCPKCKDFKDVGTQFCGSCGEPMDTYYPNKTSAEGANDLLSLCCVLSCVLVCAIIVIEIAYTFLNMGAVLTLLETAAANFIVAIPFPVVIFTLSGMPLQIYWTLIVVVILICIAKSVMGLLEAYRESKNNKTPQSIEKSGLFWVSVLLCGTIFIQFVYNFILLFFGMSIDTSWVDEYTTIELFFLVVDASVWEELITRMAYIGLPMVIASLILTKSKNSWKYLFGGFGMSKLALVLIIFSGIIFGVAHNGWGIEKIFPSALVGFVLGYLFVRFGLYASILFHFVNNAMSTISWIGLGEEGLVIVTLAIVGLGCACFGVMLIRLYKSKDAVKSLPTFK